jgi:hypothetical protein
MKPTYEGKGESSSNGTEARANIVKKAKNKINRNIIK